MVDWKLYAERALALPQIDQMVQDFSLKYSKKNERGPSGTTSEAYRLSLMLTYAPTSALFRRVMEIGNPESIHAKDTQKREFDAILTEIDRRFPYGEK